MQVLALPRKGMIGYKLAIVSAFPGCRDYAGQHWPHSNTLMNAHARRQRTAEGASAAGEGMDAL